ncbi:MAG: hypothetical protein K9L30_09935 [Desulfobacterales bacterium]|nr:hypothetical protein [Desulfobacterales bacterium]
MSGSAENIVDDKINRGSEIGSSNAKNWFKLIFATSIGILFFMTPLTINGEIKILYALFSDFLIEKVQIVPIIVLVIMLMSALLSLYFTFVKKNVESAFIKGTFVAGPRALIIRVLAAVIGILIYFKLGHEYIYNEYTGEVILYYLMPILVVSFWLACVLIPLLLDFGGVELIGVLFKRIFKPLFKLPGSSAVLAIGSLLGDGSIGIIATNKEYKKRFLTAKEGAILMFGFCTIPVPYVFIYSTSIGGVDVSLFGYLCLTILVCTLVSTAILCRIPPISRMHNTYYNEDNSENDEEDTSKNEPKLGVKAALKRAENAPTIKEMVVKGSKETFFLYMDIFPAILLIATVALVIGEFTPVFDIIAKPFVPVLNLIGLPEATTAAPAFLIGYLDLLIPFLISEEIVSQLTKFVICTIGVIQVMCLSETAALAMKSNMKITFWDVTFVVIEKTIICLPIAFIMGKLIGLS